MPNVAVIGQDTPAIIKIKEGPAGSPATAYLLQGVSTTFLAIQLGPATWLTQAGKAWTLGHRVRASSPDGTFSMEGLVTAYDGDALTLAVDRVRGAGANNEWTICVTGEVGDPLYRITVSESDPSGGQDGDIWLQL